MTRKEMEFVIECIQRYRTWLREDARMSEKAIREDDYLNKENIMSKKIKKLGSQEGAKSDDFFFNNNNPY